MPRKQLFDGNFELLATTQFAIQVSDDDGRTKHWLPKSQIEYENLGDGTVDVTMPEWLAKEKGII